MRKTVAGWVLTVLMVGLLAGCRQGPGPDLRSPLATPGSSAFTSPVPAPRNLPTPAAGDKATVGGVLIHDAPGKAPQPYAGVTLYLSTLVKDKSGTPAMAGLDKAKAPKAMTDATGAFAFTDVPPNTYALILAGPLTDYLLNQPGTGSALLIEVKGGEVKDLGELHYDLPLP